MKSFLVTTAEDLKSAAALRLPSCYLFYRVGGDGALQRRGLPASARGGVMGVFDDGAAGWDSVDYDRLARDIAGECARRSYGGVLLDFQESAGALEAVRRVAPALAARRLVPFVPLALARACEHGKVIVPSDVSGGDFSDMLRHYAARFPPERLCLELVRVCSDFVMPSYTAEGRPLSAGEFRALLEKYRPQSYFSAELCAKYFTYQDDSRQVHFLLHDDPSTAARKLRAAAGQGYFAAFVLYRDWGAAAADVMAAE